MPKHFLLLIGVSSSVLYTNFVAWCRGQFVDDDFCSIGFKLLPVFRQGCKRSVDITPLGGMGYALWLYSSPCLPCDFLF